MHTNIFDLKKMSDVKVEEADLNELVDINTININVNSSKKEKIESFIKQAKNPYVYKSGKFTVKISFTENTVTVRDRLKEYLTSL